MARSKIVRGVDQINAYLDGDTRQAQIFVPDQIDVKAIRQHLRMSQAQFAKAFGLNTRTVQNWEQGDQPQDVARAYLRVIEKDPDAVRRALSAKP